MLKNIRFWHRLHGKRASFKLTEYNPRILELFEVSEEEIKAKDIYDFSCREEGYTKERAREAAAQRLKMGEHEAEIFEAGLSPLGAALLNQS